MWNIAPLTPKYGDDGYSNEVSFDTCQLPPVLNYSWLLLGSFSPGIFLSHSQFLLSRRLISVFGRVARLDDVTLANVDLQLHVNVSINRPPDRTWRRPPGRPQNKWLTGYETIPRV